MFLCPRACLILARFMSAATRLKPSACFKQCGCRLSAGRPAAFVSCPRIKLLKERGRDILIDPSTEAKLLAASSQPLHDVILIMQDTGMRPQDVFRMRWEHLIWFKRVLFIPYGKTKNSRRYVPLSERVIKALQLRGASASGWVFPSSLSKSGHVSNVANQWRCTRKKIGLDPRREALLLPAYVRNGRIGADGQPGGAHESLGSRRRPNRHEVPTSGIGADPDRRGYTQPGARGTRRLPKSPQ
jgi:hypothetical protein